MLWTFHLVRRLLTAITKKIWSVIYSKAEGKLRGRRVPSRRAYQITRIFGQEPQIIFDGQALHGVALRETVLHKPVYVGQKDLSNTGAGFEYELI